MLTTAVIQNSQRRFKQKYGCQNKWLYKKKTEKLSLSTLSSCTCIKTYTKHTSRTCSRGRLAGCEHYSIRLAAVSSLSLTVFRRQPLGSSSQFSYRRHSPTRFNLSRISLTAAFYGECCLVGIRITGSEWRESEVTIVSLYLDVLDDGASQMERPTFVGYTGVQNGLFWCVHNEDLWNAPYLHLYILITTGRFLKMKLVLKI